jgi:cell division protein FtsL
MGRARVAPVVAAAARSSSRRVTTGTDPYLSSTGGRSLRPRSGSYTRRSLPPTPVSRVPQGLVSLLATVVASALVTASVVMLVWVKMTQVQAGYAIHKHQQELLELKRERSALEVEVSSLRRPERLARVGQQYFGLRAPAPGQVVRVDDLAALKTSAPAATGKAP